MLQLTTQLVQFASVVLRRAVSVPLAAMCITASLATPASADLIHIHRFSQEVRKITADIRHWLDAATGAAKLEDRTLERALCQGYGYDMNLAGPKGMSLKRFFAELRPPRRRLVIDETNIVLIFDNKGAIFRADIVEDPRRGANKAPRVIVSTHVLLLGLKIFDNPARWLAAAAGQKDDLIRLAWGATGYREEIERVKREHHEYKHPRLD